MREPFPIILTVAAVVLYRICCNGLDMYRQRQCGARPADPIANNAPLVMEETDSADVIVHAVFLDVNILHLNPTPDENIVIFTSRLSEHGSEQITCVAAGFLVFLLCWLMKFCVYI